MHATHYTLHRTLHRELASRVLTAIGAGGAASSEQAAAATVAQQRAAFGAQGLIALLCTSERPDLQTVAAEALAEEAWSSANKQVSDVLLSTATTATHASTADAAAVNAATSACYYCWC
jgi:electron transfer flavoprotein alpha subunit